MCSGDLTSFTGSDWLEYLTLAMPNLGMRLFLDDCLYPYTALHS